MPDRPTPQDVLIALLALDSYSRGANARGVGMAHALPRTAPSRSVSDHLLAFGSAGTAL
jgi:hypothetical protein